MLDPMTLESQLKSALSAVLVPAIKQCKLQEFPSQSEIGNEIAEKTAKTFDEMVSASLAKAIAGAIDYYVKNISITGTIITAGTPVTQTAPIISLPTPIANGKVPNTLGVM